jgi:hypothetical protein
VVPETYSETARPGGCLSNIQNGATRSSAPALEIVEQGHGERDVVVGVRSLTNTACSSSIAAVTRLFWGKIVDKKLERVRGQAPRAKIGAVEPSLPGDLRGA